LDLVEPVALLLQWVAKGTLLCLATLLVQLLLPEVAGVAHETHPAVRVVLAAQVEAEGEMTPHRQVVLVILQMFPLLKAIMEETIQAGVQVNAVVVVVALAQ
jgi:hypothetical protein